MKNEKTIKLDYIRHSEKVENRTSKEAGRMKNTFFYLMKNGFTVFGVSSIRKILLPGCIYFTEITCLLYIRITHKIFDIFHEKWM